jgi:hypothetical protein
MPNPCHVLLESKSLETIAARLRPTNDQRSVCDNREKLAQSWKIGCHEMSSKRLRDRLYESAYQDRSHQQIPTKLKIYAHEEGDIVGVPTHVAVKPLREKIKDRGHMSPHLVLVLGLVAAVRLLGIETHVCANRYQVWASGLALQRERRQDWSWLICLRINKTRQRCFVDVDVDSVPWEVRLKAEAG